MSRKLAAITGVHGYVPEYVLTNKELESMVDTTDEWIRSRTGIHQRHILRDPEMTGTDMGAMMVKGLLEKTNTSPDEVDMILCATVTADLVFPDNANTIADKAGIKNAFGYDINAACSGFLFALTTAAKFVESGSHKKVVVVGMDVMSSIIDYNDRTTCVIFGDGGGAVLIEPSDEFGVVDSVFRGDGSGRHHLHMKAGGSALPASHETIDERQHFVYQEGRPVFKHAVKGMSGTIKEVMDRNELTADQIDWIIPHQANIRIINSVADALDFPKERVIVNIEKYGNTTAGTLPLCLWDFESKINKGDRIILTAFGGGFTWGATYLRWAID